MASRLDPDPLHWPELPLPRHVALPPRRTGMDIMTLGTLVIGILFVAGCLLVAYRAVKE